MILAKIDDIMPDDKDQQLTYEGKNQEQETEQKEVKEALIVAEQVKKDEYAHILKTQRALAFSKRASLRRALVLWRKNTQLAKEEAAAFSKGASLRRALVLWRKNTQLAKEEATYELKVKLLVGTATVGWLVKLVVALFEPEPEPTFLEEMQGLGQLAMSATISTVVESASTLEGLLNATKALGQ